MSFDYKKEYKEFYLPKRKPTLVTIPPMNYVAIPGMCDPNSEGGAYQIAVGVLYTVAYTIKMSKMGDHRIDGYFDYVVPPLEGFWWQEGVSGCDYSDKGTFHWIAMIRLPEFVTAAELEWAKEEVSRKKKIDCTQVQFLSVDEGLCVQCMHIGPYDQEPATVAIMKDFINNNSCQFDFSDTRQHHEIYLSDPRKCAPEKLKTVIRHPVKRCE